MPCLKPSLEQDGNLGPDTARARNRRSLSAAHCAGCGGIGKTLEPEFEGSGAAPGGWTRHNREF